MTSSLRNTLSYPDNMVVSWTCGAPHGKTQMNLARNHSRVSGQNSRFSHNRSSYLCGESDFNQVLKTSVCKTCRFQNVNRRAVSVVAEATQDDDVENLVIIGS